jgi:TrmH family RNA methyltransferase
MITSSDNDRLKRIRKLRDRKWRDREGMFVTEGEDLLNAGIAAGRTPVDVLVAPGSVIEGSGFEGSGIAATEVEPGLLDGVSQLGSGTRVIAVWEQPGGDAGSGPAVHLDGVGDPGNVGTIVRTAAALTGARVVLGGGCADAYSPKAVRASMGSIFAAPPRRGNVDDTPSPRLGLVAHGGSSLDDAVAALGGVPTLCLGGERSGLPEATIEACDATATIPLREGAESLNVAAAAAIGLQRISSLAAAGDSD